MPILNANVIPNANLCVRARHSIVNEWEKGDSSEAEQSRAQSARLRQRGTLQHCNVCADANASGLARTILIEALDSDCTQRNATDRSVRAYCDSDSQLSLPLYAASF